MIILHFGCGGLKQVNVPLYIKWILQIKWKLHNCSYFHIYGQRHIYTEINICLAFLMILANHLINNFSFAVFLKSFRCSR